jgi:hypothetical protein
VTVPVSCRKRHPCKIMRNGPERDRNCMIVRLQFDGLSNYCRMSPLRDPRPAREILGGSSVGEHGATIVSPKHPAGMSSDGIGTLLATNPSQVFFSSYNMSHVMSIFPRIGHPALRWQWRPWKSKPRFFFWNPSHGENIKWTYSGDSSRTRHTESAVW